MRIFGGEAGSVISPTSSGFDNAFYIARAVTLAAALTLLVICEKRFDKKLEFEIPWKVTVGIAPFACVAWCAVVIVKVL